MRRGIETIKRAVILAAVLALIYLPARAVYAAGTSAGTNITNRASENHTIGGSGVSADSNTTLDKVAEIIGVIVTWLDAADIPVSPGESNKAATFKVSNPGNGSEKFALVVNAAVPGDDFDPVPAAIYLDANGNGIYDSGADTLYTSGANDPVISADGYATVFVLCDIPAGTADGAAGLIQLTATSKTGTGAVGTVFAGMGDGGGDAVIGTTGGAASQTAKYLTSGVGALASVSILKTAVIIDQSGGTKAKSGSTIRYTIKVTVTGIGTASGVVITDPIPDKTDYTAGTLALNGTALSEAKDADAGDAGGTTEGTLTVSLGDLTSASPPQVITFEVKIE